MNDSMQGWLVMGAMFAGAPALALARRWDALALGLTIPRACGPEPAPEPLTEPVSVPEPAVEPGYAMAPAPAFLRLGRVDDSMDADRRARRYRGLIRAGF